MQSGTSLENNHYTTWFLKQPKMLLKVHNYMYMNMYANFCPFEAFKLLACTEEHIFYTLLSCLLGIFCILFLTELFLFAIQANNFILPNFDSGF